MTMKADHAGFTLVELMVVIGILAIIAGIAIPAYQSYITAARAATCQNEALAIQTAQEEFFNTNSVYFGGANIAALKGASTGLWRPSPDVDAGTSDCLFSVVAGSTGNVATSYTIISTGTANLSSAGKLFEIGN